MKRPAKYTETRISGCSLTAPLKRGNRPDLAALRVREVRSLLTTRWGRTVPLLDDPDTRSQLVAFADLAAAAHRGVRGGRDTSPAAVERRVVDLLLLVCSDLQAEAREIASAALDMRRQWLPEDLGEVFELSAEERERLRITQMRPAGLGGSGWEAFRRERERLRGERRRREAGARPKAEIAAAAADLREEIAEFLAATGKSESTFWRWRRKGKDWRDAVTVRRPEHCSYIGPDAALSSSGAPSGAPRDPAAVLAEIVIRSTGHCPSVVMVEGDEAIVLNAPALAVLAGLPRRGTGAASVKARKPADRPRSDLKRPWELVTKRAGLEGVRIHDLRHTNASIGAAAGLGLPIIGKLLGHTQASTPQRYAHLDNDPLRKAADRIGSEIARAMGDAPPSKDGDGAEIITLHRGGAA